jgi:hypothetical protein
MWYPVRTRVSVRKESQFKIDCPDVWQLWSGRWCIVYGKCRFDFNRPDISPSWSGRTRIRYGNCVLKFSRPDAPAHGPDAQSLIWKLLTADVRPSGRCSYTGKISPWKFRKILSHSCPSGRFLSTVQTAPRHILPDAHSDPQPINRGPWALRAARIRYWIPQLLRDVVFPLKPYSSVLLPCYNRSLS